MLRYRIEAISDYKSMHITYKNLTEPEAVHWHEFYEIELILSGAGTYNINGTEYPISRGSMFLMNPCSFSSVYFSEQTTLINLIFTTEACDVDFLLKIFNSRPYFTLQINEDDIPFFCILADELVYHHEKNKEIDHYTVNLINCYLGKILNHYVISDASQDITGLQYAILYLQNHFSEPITLEDVAKVANYSPNYFSNQFKQYTSITFKQYLLDLRFNFARNLLIHTELSVQQISDKCGFRDYSHFFTSFKKQFGMTPKQCRENIETTND